MSSSTKEYMAKEIGKHSDDRKKKCLELTCRMSAHFHQLRNDTHLSDCNFYGNPEGIQTYTSENLPYQLDASPQSTKFPL